MSETKYRIGGMTCGGCATSVSKAIQAKDPSALVDVNLEAAQITVQGSLDATSVEDAVEGAGFDFDGVVAD